MDNYLRFFLFRSIFKKNWRSLVKCNWVIYQKCISDLPQCSLFEMYWDPVCHESDLVNILGLFAKIPIITMYFQYQQIANVCQFR